MIQQTKQFKETLNEVEHSRCFVPFIGGVAEQLERRAIAVKRCLGLADREAIDPWGVARAAGVPIVDRPEQFAVLGEELCDVILGEFAACWSAATLPGPAGPLIVANYQHSRTRLRVTLAEELAHLVIGHPPSEIDKATGMRTYSSTVEEEAFGVGGALVMPYQPLFDLVNRGVEIDSIARQFEVSPQLANYRVNRAGLRKVYARRAS
jgi:hypothetical protein